MPPSSRVLPFLLVFAGLFLFSTIVTVISEFTDVKWVDAVIRIGEGLGRLSFVSVAIAFILVEGIPLLAAWYKREMRIKALEEGRASERKVWQDWRDELEEWERQKAEADAAGVAFDKPRPPAPDAEQRSSV